MVHRSVQQPAHCALLSSSSLSHCAVACAAAVCVSPRSSSCRRGRHLSLQRRWPFTCLRLSMGSDATTPTCLILFYFICFTFAAFFSFSTARVAVAVASCPLLLAGCIFSPQVSRTHRKALSLFAAFLFVFYCFRNCIYICFYCKSLDFSSRSACFFVILCCFIRIFCNL